MLCLQRQSTENIVKRNWLDLELYVRVKIKDFATYKVNPKMLEEFGITENDLFNTAWDCTKPTIEVSDMSQILKKMGFEVPEIAETSMIVAKNKFDNNGAIAIYDIEALLQVANRYNTDLVILPSSIHECILVPINKDTNFEELNEMVREVNESEVAPEDVLSNHIYIFNRNTKQITY